jgi:hypothetical protein
MNYKSNTMGATCGTGIAYPSTVSDFTPVFSGVRVTGFFVLCVVFCRSLYVRFLFVCSFSFDQCIVSPSSICDF